MSVIAYQIFTDGQSRLVSLPELEKPASDDSFVWINADPKDAETMQVVFDKFALDPMLLEMVNVNSHRPRLEVFDDHIFLSLRGVNLTGEELPEDMVNLRILCFSNVILTFHTRKMTTTQAMSESLDKQKYAGCSAFLGRILSLLGDRIKEEVEEIEEAVLGLEDISLEGNIDRHQDDLSVLRRRLSAFQKYLVPQAGVMHELHRVPFKWIRKKEKALLKNQAERMSTLIGELEHLRQRMGVLQEEIKSTLSDRMGQTMFRLTIVSAIMLPLSLLAGLLGANVGGMPFADNPNGFLMACVMSVGLGALGFGVLKLLKWI